MKLGFVITNISFSGAQNVFNAITAELQEMGHVIFILATNESENINKHHENIIGLLPEKGSRYGKQINKVLGIREFAISKELDALIAFGFNSNIKTIVAGLGTKIPVFISDRMDPRSFPGPKDYALRLERRVFYPFAAGLIVQTNEIKEFYSKSIREKTTIIPNPVRETGIECVAGIKRKPAIVTVTRIDEKQKNLRHLVDSFGVFAESHHDFELWIIGNGPDEQMIQDYVEKKCLTDKVRLLGRKEKPLELVKQCQMFTLVSYHEGMPNALIEAMSIGMPCVVEHFSGGAAEELIDDRKNGVLLKNHDSDALAKAFDMLANNFELQELIGKEAYKINERLSLRKIAQEWENTIRVRVRG